jgi:hypothetical protein
VAVASPGATTPNSPGYSPSFFDRSVIVWSEVTKVPDGGSCSTTVQFRS